uniref:Uncharacterized protein n=1 Tax=Panagrolaimus davidi TaxID=227884 RepID=A0A914QA30_9BILA
MRGGVYRLGMASSYVNTQFQMNAIGHDAILALLQQCDNKIFEGNGNTTFHFELFIRDQRISIHVDAGTELYNTILEKLFFV